MNRFVVIASFVLVAVLLGAYFLRDDSIEIRNFPPKGSKVVAFGDSLVYGVGAETGGGFVTMLSERLGVEIVNLGRGGDTTKLGLNRIAEVQNMKPDIVLVLLGGNDAIRRVDEDVVFQNLEQIVTTLQNDGAVVVLLGIKGGLFGDDYARDFRKLAKERGTPHVSDVLDGLFSNTKYMSDFIHPNELGYTDIADRVEPILRHLLDNVQQEISF